jgi:hypothetical protein
MGGRLLGHQVRCVSMSDAKCHEGRLLGAERESRSFAPDQIYTVSRLLLLATLEVIGIAPAAGDFLVDGGNDYVIATGRAPTGS